MLTNEDITTLVKDFRKDELMAVAEELGMHVSPEATTAKKLAKAIYDNLIEEGVPEFQECSETLAEFCISAALTDEDGNILEMGDDNTAADVSGASKSLNVSATQDKMPDCFAFEDDKDPACRKCKVATLCRQSREANRPECFGKYFEPHSEECKVCIEAAFCVLAMPKTAKKIA